MSESSSAGESRSEKKNTNPKLEQRGRREAFIGLIAPIGIDMNAVISALCQELNKVNYQTNALHLTDIFRENPSWYNVQHRSEGEKYRKYIKAGDKLCQESGRKDMLALYGIAKLERFSTRDQDFPTDVIHIFRQIKRIEEIKAFNQVYGRNILFVSCYAPRADRINFLVKKMLKTDRSTSKTKLESQALDIIALDEEERDNPYGQRVVECYPHADFIMDCSSHASLQSSANRFVQMFFGAPFLSPTPDEYCSYIANAASYRSLDLSRQVGAAIFGKQCEVISLGCNEVPRAGGGTYWSDEDQDGRDFSLGYDSNQKVRDDLARDALLRLQKKKWLGAAFADLTPDELVEAAFADDPDTRKKGPLASSMMKDLIEFGRMVHAEMNALADAARFRRSTIGATLYCTVMPCHMCAKLIIAAGIDRVVYLQPYSKSLVQELFGDSVAIDEHPEAKRVTFDSLKGATPNGFKRAFHKDRKRKNPDGTAEEWDPATAEPSFSSTFAYYGPLEVKAKSDFKAALQLIAQKHPQQRTLAFGKSRTVSKTSKGGEQTRPKRDRGAPTS